MKREFGKTAWNDEGMKYYKDTLKVWKMMFSPKHEHFKTMEGAWDMWLMDLRSSMNQGWTRKDMAHLLATHAEADVAMMEEADDDIVGTDAEYEYDSEDDGAPMIGLGGTRRQVESLEEEDAGGQMGNGMNQEDDAASTVAGVARGRERRVIREEEDELHGTKTTGLDDEIDKAAPTTRPLFGDLDDDKEGEGNTTTKRKSKKGKKTGEPSSKRQRVGARGGAKNM
jgi:hypothetical protein